MIALRRILLRLVYALLLVWAVLTVTFFLNHALPGDPARMIAGPQARPDAVEMIRKKYGLDKPWYVQYGKSMRRIVHFGPTLLPKGNPEAHESCVGWGYLHLDLGMSYQDYRPVARTIGERLPRTAILALAAVLISVCFGVLSGLLAALRKGTWVDSTTVAIALLGISTPAFTLGVMLQWLLGYRLRWLPLDGIARDYPGFFWHLVLPAVTLGLITAAYYTRLVRSELVDIFKADYIRTAKAKGLSAFRVVYVHALRNALVPIVTVIGLLGGAVITEQVFSWPGIGQLAVRSMRDRDNAMIMATVMIGALAIVIASVVVDALYAILDPRSDIQPH
jgi:peptide/nickel transport system permease protein